MKFLDANIFIYAYYKPKKPLTTKEKQMKEFSKNTLTNISQVKEEIITTVIQLSEVVNNLKHRVPSETLAAIIQGLFMLENVNVKGVSAEEYFAATELGKDLNLEPNDALAVDVMRQNDINEIYSFDEHFDNIEGIIRLPAF